MEGAGPTRWPLPDRVDPEPVDPDDADRRASRRRIAWGVALGALALFLLVRLFVDDGAGSITDELDDDSVQQLETVESLVTQPPKARRPHITVEQQSDVVDGEVIEVAGTGFEDGAEVELRQCAGEIGCTKLEPVEASGEIGTYRTSFRTDDAGTFTARVAVRRFVVGPVGEPPINCSAPDTPDRCHLTAVVYFTGRSLYPAPVLLHFTDGDPDRQRPVVVADATSGLIDGQKVRLAGLGFSPGSIVRPVLCSTDPSPRCVDLAAVEPVTPAEPDTSVEVVVEVPMRSEGLDCRIPRACNLNLSPQASGGFPTPSPVPVSFDIS